MFRISALILALFCGVAQADNLPLMGVGAGNPATYTGPGDVVSGANAWYSCQRAYNAAYATGSNKGCNVRRASDSETCDFLIATTGSIGLSTACSGADNGVSLATYCNATTCAVTKAYDQTGNGNDASQATAASQPNLTPSAFGSLAAMQTTGGTGHSLVTGATVTSSTQPLSYSAVAEATTLTTSPFVGPIISSFQSGTQIQFAYWDSTTSASGAVRLYAGANTTVTAAANALHAFQVLVNNASSVVRVDNTETTVSPSSGSSTNKLGLFNDASPGGSQLIGYIGEAGYWNGHGFSGTERTNLCHNQFVYWGTAASC